MIATQILRLQPHILLVNWEDLRKVRKGSERFFCRKLLIKYAKSVW